MYLPSKTKLRYIATIFLAIFLIFLSFQSAIRNVLMFFSHQLTVTYKKNIRQVEKLRTENLSLRWKIEKNKNLYEENLKLKTALNFQAQNKISLIGAEVITYSPSNWRRIAVINAGKNKGVTVDSIAVDEKGNLLGKIFEVNAKNSRIIFTNDPTFSLPVFIGKKSFGMLKGNIVGAKILYIEDSSEITTKDKIWVKIPSSALSIEVGEIIRIKKNPNNLFCDVDAKLFLKESLLDKVFIVQ